MTAPELRAPETLDRLARAALRIGLVAAAACALGALLDWAAFLRAWLVAVQLWLGVALGSFALALLHHVTRGAWGLMVRRVLEASARTLPFLALLFLPLLLGLGHLYPWARPHEGPAHFQEAWLNVPFFVARTLVYFAAWIALAARVHRLSVRQDEPHDRSLLLRLRQASAPGLALYCLTATFASIDWLLSLRTGWGSTIYGVYFVGGHAVSALAFTVLVAAFLARRGPMASLLQPGHFHDYGKLLHAFVLLWAYFGFSQFLIVWSGNLPEEAGWYADRAGGGWRRVSLALVLFHFALPFALLLSRKLKRDPRRLAGVAALLLVMRWVDLFWLVAPAFHPGRLAVHWLDLAAPLALGGGWLWLFARELRRRPLVPLHDPDLAGVVVHG